jgi:hypothetical protein
MLKSEVILKWWWAKFNDNLTHKKIEWPDIWTRYAISSLILTGLLSQRYPERNIPEQMNSQRSLQEQMKRLRRHSGKLLF